MQTEREKFIKLRSTTLRKNIYFSWYDYEEFVKDMGVRPNPNYKLSRKDKAIGFFKENCEWTMTVVDHPMYRLWRSLVARVKTYNFEMDERWFKFNNFLKDVGERPEKSKLIKVDKKKSYCKENCQWKVS